jgi:hypothetical protein
VDLDQYDELKKYVSTFFNSLNDDKNSKMKNLVSHGQQQMLNLQETFFKSKINFFLIFIGLIFFRL